MFDSAQTEAGKAELAQEMKRARAAAVRTKILMRGASPEKRRRASARDVFDSFDVDGSGTIDVREANKYRCMHTYMHAQMYMALFRMW